MASRCIFSGCAEKNNFELPVLRIAPTRVVPARVAPTRIVPARVAYAQVASACLASALVVPTRNDNFRVASAQVTFALHSFVFIFRLQPLLK